MASAKPGVHIVRLKPVTVPKYMIDGDKFVKWEEDTASATPVTLKVDENGFFLYWVNLNKETTLLDISTIRDTRCGKSTRIPTSQKLIQQINYGSSPDSLKDKTLTILSGPDFVNLTYYTFTGEKGEVVKTWSADLLKLATNLLQLNSPVISFLTKIHTRLTLQTDKDGRIPLKTIAKTFSNNKEDRRRVEKALGDAGVVVTDSIPPSALPFNPTFFSFYTHLTSRSEVQAVFSTLTPTPLLPALSFTDFINQSQRDPRLNEILYPYATEDKARELIDAYEPSEVHRAQGMLSFQGFLRYILSEDNAVVSYEKYDLSDDMDQPLSHYFINSSHNTYLTGHQLTGKSSIEMYRQALLAGCRCVELDFWNGPREEPVVVHGYTLVPDIPAKEVFEAIAECAFKTSDYPVVLSFENHCNHKQQARIAGYCREFFGDMLLEGEVEGWELSPGSPLPPPSSLKHKIIIKNKKKHFHSHHHHHHHSSSKKEEAEAESEKYSSDSDSDSSSGDVSMEEEMDKIINKVGVGGGGGVGGVGGGLGGTSASDAGTAGKESEAGAEISALVNYVQPVHFYSFEISLARNRSYEMSSFDEKQAMTLLKQSPVEFVNYNKHQLSRVYPRGTRVDSGNFMPQLFWNAGCQLVALNYQTLDLPMQLNLGIFELNRRCGFLLKPEFMRRKDRNFDPFAESTVDGVVAGSVGVKIISGQFLSNRTRVGVYVEAEMYGLPTDTIRKKFRTKLAPSSLSPTFEDPTFLFKKVVLPELALLRLVVCEEGGKPVGHRVIPVLGLRPGYRSLVLRNESGQPLSGSLFVHISVKDYVPDGLSDFAEALANPIKYQNELDKRQRQLDVLMDDGEEESSSPPNSPLPNTSAAGPSAGVADTTSTPSLHPSQASIKRPPPPTLDSPSKELPLLLCPAPSPPPPTLALYGHHPGPGVTFWVDPLSTHTSAKPITDKIDSLRKKVEGVRKKPPSSGRLLVKKLSRLELTPTTRPDLEREIVEKGMEELVKTLGKTLTLAQTKQSRLLATLKSRQANEIMKWIYTWRKEEYRRLGKLTRDKNELGRMKREVNTVLVGRGVGERERADAVFRDVEVRLGRDWEVVWGGVEGWRGGVVEGLLNGEVEQGEVGAAGGAGAHVQLLRFNRQ